MAHLYNPTTNTRRNVKNGPYLIRNAVKVQLLALTIRGYGNNTLKAVLDDGTEYTQRFYDVEDACKLLDRPQLRGKKLNLIYRTERGNLGYTLRTTTSTYRTVPTDTQARSDAAVKMQQGYYGTYTDTLPLSPYADGGYPVAFYTAEGDTLCAQCATEQIVQNTDPERLPPIDGEILTGCDVLEGSAQSHGVVMCAGCGTHIVDVDPDDEWECFDCGTVNEKGDACQCGNTETRQAAILARAAQVAAGQRELPL